MNQPQPQPRILSVSQLTALIQGSLESTFTSVWVSGEVSEISRPQSGHVYFTLKDEGAQLRSVLWRSSAVRLRFRLEEGQQVICLGDLTVYPPRGTYQLEVRRVEPQGLGALQLAFDQLKRRLAAEGLFDPARKRPLPLLPRLVGIVTSPTGAAIHDFLQVAARRCCGVRIFVIPARVQGEGATGEIVRGIQLANRVRPPLDVLVVGRGGGSLEDLWSFNEEAVVRAIHTSRVPVVSAVGHEVDVTLADLAADVRALTPSEAAERVFPAADELKQRLSAIQRRLVAMLRARAVAARRHVEQLARSRTLRDPQSLLFDLARRLDDLDQQSHRALTRRLGSARDRLTATTARLESLSPLAVLTRGYSVTTDAAGNILKSAAALRAGDTVHTRLAAGSFKSRIENIDPGV